MQSINEDMLQELEKRDTAIEEAVGLICELEGKLEKMFNAGGVSMESKSMKGRQMPDQSSYRTFSPSEQQTQTLQTPSPAKCRPEPSTRHRDHLTEQNSGSMPPPAQPTMKTRVEAPKPSRTPLFLQLEDPGTQALRKVYGVDGAALRSTHSFASMHRAHSNRTKNARRSKADTDNYTIPSPRLSEFSEGDFESVYGAKLRPASPPMRSRVDRDFTSDETLSKQSAQRLSRSYSSNDSKISDWVQDTKQTISSHQRRAAPRNSGQTFGSIQAVIGNRQSPSKLLPAPRVHEPPLLFSQAAVKYNTARTSAIFGGPIFSGDVLPPTPDTMSTSHRGTNQSNPSIITERSFVDKPSMTLDEFTRRVSEQRPYTSEGARTLPDHDALGYDSDLELEKEDPYLHANDLPPRPPPHKVSDPTLAICRPVHQVSDRPRIGTYAAGRSNPTSRTMSYPASDATAGRRSSVGSPITSPDKNAAIPAAYQEAYNTPSDRSFNGGVSLPPQDISPTAYVRDKNSSSGHDMKPSGKHMGSSAMARFFRRSSIQNPDMSILNHQAGQPPSYPHPRPRLARDQSSTNRVRRFSFQGPAKPLRAGRPNTSGGDGISGDCKSTATDAVILDDDDDEGNVGEYVDEQRGVKGMGFGSVIGKKLAGLGRRGSKGASGK